VFAIILKSPNGETFQLGGYQNYVTTDRLWQRMWPVQWTGQPASSSSFLGWESTRYLDTSATTVMGEWTLSIQLGYSGWVTTTYKGSIALKISDVSSSSDENANGGQSEPFVDGQSGRIVLLSVLIITALVIILVVGVG